MLNIVISGAPGSGKGTQSAIIVENYGLTHISTGDMLREEIKNGTENGKKAEVLINDGKLVPDEMIIAMLHDRVQKHIADGNTKGFIFDGFPRTVEQAKALKEMLATYKTDVSIMLNLEVPEEELITRLLERGKTSGRSDDNMETIKKRIDVYNTQTKPVMEFYKAEGKLANINGVGTIDGIFEKISEAINAVK